MCGCMNHKLIGLIHYAYRLHSLKRKLEEKKEDGENEPLRHRPPHVTRLVLMSFRNMKDIRN